MNYRLFDEDIRDQRGALAQRAYRSRSHVTFGGRVRAFAKRFTHESHFLPAEEVADAALALCSGMMDGISGQVLGRSRHDFFDNLMRLFEEREQFGVKSCDRELEE